MIVVFRQLLASVLSCVLAVPAFCASCDLIGNRVSKTAAGVTITYLVDTLNPTGYAQVVNESFSVGTAGNREQNHAYVYGLELISQVRSYQASFNNLTQRIYYVYDAVCASRMNLRDGHGSVRALTDPTGAVTDTYDYDAFGNLIHSSTTLSAPTLNNYLFAGEQFDSDIDLYYNRARYLNVSTGRFSTMDTYEGNDENALSLHKYLYAGADPADLTDPSGKFVSTILYGNIVHAEVTEQFLGEFRPPDGVADTAIDAILGTDAGINGLLRPDLVSRSTGEVYEIASVLGSEVRFWKVLDEVYTMNKYDPLKRAWRSGTSFIPDALIKLDALTFAIVYPPVEGVILYSVVNAGEIYFLSAIAVKSMIPQLETETGTALIFAVEGGF